MTRQDAEGQVLDIELADLPSALRWREWMMRVEAVIFAAPEPVKRETLNRIVGSDCSIDLLIEDIRAELAGRPYEIVAVAHGWHFRTRPGLGPLIGFANGAGAGTAVRLNQSDMLTLASIAYHQPVTRKGLAEITGRDVGRDGIGRLRSMGMITNGPRSPEPGSPYTYVTTDYFLSHFGLSNLGDLPDVAAMQDAGLVGNDTVEGDLQVPVSWKED